MKITPRKESIKFSNRIISMEKFKFVDITTADVAFDAYGSNLNELFANAALAMFEVMIDTGQVNARVCKKVTATGEDLESLMFNWLNALLVYVDAENLAFCVFDVKIDEKFNLSAECSGEEIDTKRHETRTVIKAATYHQLKVENENGLWKARVIIDI